MGITNLGRVQGGSVFYTTAASETSINKSTLTPTNITPLVGDSILFANGDIRQIITVTDNTITCGSVITNLKGEQGDQGPKGDIGAGSNPNLLINGDFKINQRGLEEYTNTEFTVDYWNAVMIGTTKVEVLHKELKKGVRVSFGSQYAKFRQIRNDCSLLWLPNIHLRRCKC